MATKGNGAWPRQPIENSELKQKLNQAEPQNCGKIQVQVQVQVKHKVERSSSFMQVKLVVLLVVLLVATDPFKPNQELSGTRVIRPIRQWLLRNTHLSSEKPLEPSGQGLSIITNCCDCFFSMAAILIVMVQSEFLKGYCGGG